MFEIVLRFRSNTLKTLLEDHYGTTRLAPAIKNSIRDLVAGSKMQAHMKKRETEMQATMQKEAESIRNDVQGHFDDDPGDDPTP